MEDIIIIGIIVVSVIVNIIRNYQKETEKNAKRTIGNKPQTSPPTPSPEPIINYPEAWSDKPVGNQKYPDVLETLDSLENEYTFESEKKISDANYNKTANHRYDDIYSHSIHEVVEDHYSLTPPEEPKTNKMTAKNFNSFFETKDELKKAIIYSAILERKF